MKESTLLKITSCNGIKILWKLEENGSLEMNHDKILILQKLNWKLEANK